MVHGVYPVRIREQDELPRDVKIRASDGFDLAGTLYAARAPRGFVCLNSATGVPRELYTRFASHLATSGYSTLTYDYRGIGGSRPKSLRGFHATMSDWARLDMSAALAWSRAEFGGLPIFVFGHSIGAQLVGLVEQAETADAIVSVASSTGVWWKMSGSYRWFCAAVWYGLIPITTSALGYAPSRRLGLGEDLPLGVAREWSLWCRSGRYFDGHLPQKELSLFSKIRAPWLSIGITDDPIANEETIAQLCSFYPSAQFERRRFSPSDANERKLGHFGFFSRKATTLWPEVLGFLDRIAIRNDAGEV